MKGIPFEVTAALYFQYAIRTWPNSEILLQELTYYSYTVLALESLGMFGLYRGLIFYVQHNNLGTVKIFCLAFALMRSLVSYWNKACKIGFMNPADGTDRLSTRNYHYSLRNDPEERSTQDM